VVLLGLTILPYGLALTNRFSALTMLGFAVLMGIGLAGIGFAISHDALHGAYSRNPRVNELLGRTFDLLGANGYMWKITHNVIHHTIYQYRRHRRRPRGVTRCCASPRAPRCFGSTASSTCTASRRIRCPRSSGCS
jgi:fatty acid desaturase